MRYVEAVSHVKSTVRKDEINCTAVHTTQLMLASMMLSMLELEYARD